MNGEKVITDVTANDDKWHHVAVTWTSDSGDWKMYRDGELKDQDKGLANGQQIESKILLLYL